MTTNVTIIGDALRLLGVIAESQPVSPNQGEHALRVLNQMMDLWTESGIDLGWFEQSATTDDAPLPKWAELGVTSKLAQQLQPTYPAGSLAPAVFDYTKNGYATILRKAIHEQIRPVRMDHMPMGEGRIGFRSKILTDN